MDYQVLKTEIALPAYVAMTDVEIAASINTVNITRARATLSGSEILNATDSGEFTGLTDAQKSSWLAVCGVDEINTSTGIAKSLEATLFGAGTTTRANLIAVKNETISRGTELGLGRVRAGDVIHARNI